VATVILSNETVLALIEAHASMAAWYYQMSDALREANTKVDAPSDDQRKAFVSAMGQHFPELSSVIQSIDVPRPYIPPPAIPAVGQVVENEGIVIKAPPTDHLATPDMIPSDAATNAAPEQSPAPPQPEQPAAAVVAPPAIVDPTKVKYE
jgi:hypothetical protein